MAPDDLCDLIVDELPVDNPLVATAYLEYYPEGGTELTRMEVAPIPFKIGRSKDAHYTIYSQQVSKNHAEIFRRGDRYFIRDMNSTNGTCVNGQKIKDETPLSDGDILHIAHKEFSFRLQSTSDGEPSSHTLAADSGTRESLIRNNRMLYQMITEREVTVVFQPILEFAPNGVGHPMLYAYEALGRPTLPDFGHGPAKMFQLAADCGKAVDLSRLLRDVAGDFADSLAPPNFRLFVNVHPAEMESDALVDHLLALSRRLRSGVKLVVEVHEAAVTRADWMKTFREILKDNAIELAYDDFGAGQSRLMELAEVPPDFIKLDMNLIRDIHLSSPRQDLVGLLVQHMHAHRIKVLAEGIETAAEAAKCIELGCDLAQGYLYARPDRPSVLNEVWR